MKMILPEVDYQSAQRTCKLHLGWLVVPEIEPLHHLRHRDPPNVLKNRFNSVNDGLLFNNIFSKC